MDHFGMEDWSSRNIGCADSEWIKSLTSQQLEDVRTIDHQMIELGDTLDRNADWEQVQSRLTALAEAILSVRR